MPVIPSMGTENPHDRFAKSVMSKIENAKDFFGGVLPEGPRELIDIETLRLEKESYVDEELSEFFSDIVYTCRYRGSAVKLVLLFEHKSFVPKYPHLQLLQYKLNVWKRYVRNSRKPPVVLPVVLYHGTTQWNKRRFIEYLSMPVDVDAAFFAPFVDDFDYILVNLTAFQHAEIEQKFFRRTEVRTWLLVQRYIYHSNLLLHHLIPILSSGMVYFREEEGIQFLRTVLLYIDMGSGLNKNDVKKAIDKADPLIREEYMTLYEQIIQEGIETGIHVGFQKGVVRDKQEILIKLLSKKFGLTEDEKAYVKSIEDADILEKGLDKILFAETKEQVLGALK